MHLGDITGKKIKEKDLAKGYRAEGLAIFLGGLFNSFPYTAFSQNVGLSSIIRCKIRKMSFIQQELCLYYIGFVPKIGAFTTIIPTSVLRRSNGSNVRYGSCSRY